MYLKELLEKQMLTKDQQLLLKLKKISIIKIFEKKIYAENLRYVFTGSNKEKTALSEFLNLDLFIIYPSYTSLNLPQIFESIREILDKDKLIHSQLNFGFRINNAYQNFQFDIIPVKAIDVSYNEVRLYDYFQKQTFLSKIYMNANAKTDSNFEFMLKLLKLWKKRNKFPISSFMLELLFTAYILEEEAAIELSEKSLQGVLVYINKNIMNCNLYTSVSRKNVETEESIEKKKKVIKINAEKAIREIKKGSIKKIFKE